MRIISFCQKWDKLNQHEFTTFRFPRKDKDWQVGELVQVYLNNRSPKSENLGVAEIISKEIKLTGDTSTNITDIEAQVDGFLDLSDMEHWMIKTYGIRTVLTKSMNKLILKWINHMD